METDRTWALVEIVNTVECPLTAHEATSGTWAHGRRKCTRLGTEVAEENLWLAEKRNRQELMIAA